MGADREDWDIEEIDSEVLEKYFKMMRGEDSLLPTPAPQPPAHLLFRSVLPLLLPVLCNLPVAPPCPAQIFLSQKSCPIHPHPSLSPFPENATPLLLSSSSSSSSSSSVCHGRAEIISYSPSPFTPSLEGDGSDDSQPSTFRLSECDSDEAIEPSDRDEDEEFLPPSFPRLPPPPPPYCSIFVAPPSPPSHHHLHPHPAGSSCNRRLGGG